MVVLMVLWIIVINWSAKLVLLLLFLLSIWSTKIILERLSFFKSLTLNTKLDRYKLLLHIEDWANLGVLLEAAQSNDLFAGTLKIALKVESQSVQAAELAVKSYLGLEKERMEKGLTVLATLGANAPFIGLFGTVLGIIQAFGVLSNQNIASSGNSGGASVVMSSISEALVATAVGLFVAIPAVVAYNYFQRRVKTILIECESLRDFYLSKLLIGKIDFKKLNSGGK